MHNFRQFLFLNDAYLQALKSLQLTLLKLESDQEELVSVCVCAFFGQNLKMEVHYISTHTHVLAHVNGTQRIGFAVKREEILHK